MLVERVEKGRLERVLRQPATLKPFEKVTVHARATGYAREVRADIGDEVEAGAVLVELEIPEMKADLAAAEAKVGTTEAMVEKAEANVAFKKSLLELTRNLHEKAGRTKFQLDEAEAEWKLARAEHQLAEARRKEAEAKLLRVETLLDYGRVRAPFAGVVTRRHVDTGALVRGGAVSDATPLFEVERIDKLRCRIDIPEREALLVLESSKEGTLSATVSVDALGGRELEFTPQELAEKGIRFARSLHAESHHMLAEIHIPNEGGRFIPGLFAKATLVARGAAKDETILVPNPAIRAPRGEEPFVFVVAGKEDGRATLEKRPVELGATDGSRIEVLRGLEAGEEVVVRGAGGLLDGQEVVARSTSSGEAGR